MGGADGLQPGQKSSDLASAGALSATDECKLANRTTHRSGSLTTTARAGGIVAVQALVQAGPVFQRTFEMGERRGRERPREEEMMEVGGKRRRCSRGQSHLPCSLQRPAHVARHRRFPYPGLSQHTSLIPHNNAFLHHYCLHYRHVSRLCYTIGYSPSRRQLWPPARHWDHTQATPATPHAANTPSK